ncbi:hypothetical protein GEV02_24595 [Rugamonas sp. FT29W]|uniref:Uncharacterized protein n=1 Tax=Rugamonas aquatica TaxID=2743357 RepID=A0A6A7N8Y3_9BURK|nr:hypothetical protein [Rugamonas aquatica]
MQSCSWPSPDTAGVLKTVVPAQAGTHRTREYRLSMDSRVRGNDELTVTKNCARPSVADASVPRSCRCRRR